MKPILRSLFLILSLYAAFPVPAQDGAVRLRANRTNVLLQVQGDEDKDWTLQASADLKNWTNWVSFGALASSPTNPPARALGAPAGSGNFYRAVRTDGLFDTNLLRTVRLTFAEADWMLRLSNNYNLPQDVNLVAPVLVLDNGLTNRNVGVRYKGNSSYFAAGVKKSLNIEVDYLVPDQRLLGHKTLNLNNAFGDATVMREALYFNAMRRYTVCPRASLVRLYINDEYWGVYSFVQQENNQLMKEYFPSDDGDRWRAPNAPIGQQSFNSSNSALAYLGTNPASYYLHYELKTDNNTNPWTNLINAAKVLQTTPTNELRDKVENVLAVDRWLWFLAAENVFTDEDSYYAKGADYILYYEPESGRLHPVEHDGNESFRTSASQLSPVQGATATNRPVLRLLGIPELRQRYLAHMRTILAESMNPTVLNPAIDHFHRQILDALTADPKKDYTMVTYSNELSSLRQFLTGRYNFLTNHAELRPLPPLITGVFNLNATPTASQQPSVRAQVTPRDTNGLDSVWLWFRGGNYGRFNATQMWDDGAHQDGAALDGVFGGKTTNYPAGTKVQYYVEARAGNSARAASFAPARAEQETYGYTVVVASATNSPVIINEFVADNTVLTDPQGEFEDWVELRNLTNVVVDLSGRYLTDDPAKPRKWKFPDGTTLPANGYLLVWADEDGSDTPGLHANFKLSKSGEQIYLIDADARNNAVLDSIVFGAQQSNLSFGRTAANLDVWAIQTPTPGTANP